MSANYLVTGGCGFIGSHLCEALVGAGGQVRILDDLSTGHLRNIETIADRVTLIQGDIRSFPTVLEAMQGVSYVFHEAALVSVFDSVERPQVNHDINLTGTLHVMMAARQCGVKRVVMASSAAVYGNTPALPKHEAMPPHPESPYAVSKLAGEYYLNMYHALFGLETVSLRYFNVYGPRQDPSSVYSGVISKFMDAVCRQQSPVIYGDGHQSRDFVHVRDVVQANMLAMHDPAVGKGDVFNVATGRSGSLLDLLSALSELVQRKVEPEFRPARAGDIRASAAAIDRIQQTLGFDPAFDLKSGLATMLSKTGARS